MRIDEKENSIGKIYLLNHIENFIYSFLYNSLQYQERETMLGIPSFNDNTNINADEKNSDISIIINNYFGHFENNAKKKNFSDANVIDAALLIYKYIEEKLAKNGKDLKDINFKKHAKLLNDIIIKWFKQNSKISEKSVDFMEKNKKIDLILKKYISDDLVQEFFKVRGEQKIREEVLAPHVMAIKQAIKETNLTEAAHRFNLKPSALRHFVVTHSKDKYIPANKEVSEDILLEIIDMINKDIILGKALSTVNEKYDIQITSDLFWRSIKKIDPKYNVSWYKEKREENKKKMEEKAIAIIGKENIEYIKKLPKLTIEEIEPYLERIQKALLASNNITVCRLLGKQEHIIWQIFAKYKPGWWKENMAKYKIKEK